MKYPPHAADSKLSKRMPGESATTCRAPKDGIDLPDCNATLIGIVLPILQSDFGHDVDLQMNEQLEM